ncbi:MAG: hypothetical protein L0Y50_09720 [Beijerinckiaceae bacterium]|nr:hypothetical protein [Beijerinckiaceae bacterium]MCI0736531.1 hypothetical protein [Beijerinckiaceae bacterium]
MKPCSISITRMARYCALLCAAAAVSFILAPAKAQEGSQAPGLAIMPADPSEMSDGTLGGAARVAIEHGPLPTSPATAAAKAAANRASAEAETSGAKRPFVRDEAAPGREPGLGQLAPSIAAGFNKQGLTGTTGSPPDTTGAIGPTRFVQLVNRRAGIFNRTTGETIGSGTLNQLANVAASVNSFDPQAIWDPDTNRFYYVMDSIFSATDNRLSFGFSKTANPNNVTTDWCHYTLGFGTRFPDYPKLGDSQHFAIIGVNSFNAADVFLGSDLIAISKPPAGTSCPSFATFKVGKKNNLLDSGGAQVATPVPANQIDTNPTGYAVAISDVLPSNKIWFFNLTRNATTGLPVFGSARGVTVPSYAIPANASQPVFTQRLDTLDARNTQAVQAIDPRFGNKFAFWTQHTIASGNVSAVRWYEIDPVPPTPVILRSGNIARSDRFRFNAAISPDRRRDGAVSQFGDSFVIEYNVSGSVPNISPRIVAASSASGGPISVLLVKNGAGPYRDFTCPFPGDTCRWGDYSGATPDPRPVINGRGVVWGTNQFSGVVNPPANDVNWRTQIFAVKP